MQTNYKKINSFEAGVISMIVVGFLLVGAMVFSGLTPRTQTQVAHTFDMFDIHEQVSQTFTDTADVLGLVYDLPNEFFNQFYIAFIQVVTLPNDKLEDTSRLVSDISNLFANISNNLAAQVASGYAADEHPTVALALEGKVLGAVVDAANNEIANLVEPKPVQAACAPECRIPRVKEEVIKTYYEYSPPRLSESILSWNKLLIINK